MEKTIKRIIEIMLELETRANNTYQEQREVRELGWELVELEGTLPPRTWIKLREGVEVCMNPQGKVKRGA